MGDDENSAGRHFLADPELEQFVSQVFRREHVERGKRLIHEQDFGFHHQGARKADALLHAAGKLFRVRALKTIKADGVENSQGAFVALERAHPASFERSFHVVEDRQPRKQCEALKHDGNARVLRRNWLPMPQYLARRRLAESGQNTQ